MEPVIVGGIAYRLAAYRGGYCVSFTEGVRRRRPSLGTSDLATARVRFAAFIKGLRDGQHVSAQTIDDVWQLYIASLSERGKPVDRQGTAWVSLAPAMAGVQVDEVPGAAKRFTARRRASGYHDGGIWSDLVYLRAAFNHAVKVGAIDRAPHIPLPPKPAPRERYLDRDQARRLLAGAGTPHVRLFIVLGLATAGRASAILGLTWDRVDFGAGVIDLREPGRRLTTKGRAVVPINETARAELEVARGAAMTNHVIEYAGQPVGSIKKGVAAAAKRAGLPWVTPHVLRHTAAVWMAEAGVPMTQIAQYLGHRDSRTTERVYARYSPGFLASAARALNL